MTELLSTTELLSVTELSSLATRPTSALHTRPSLYPESTLSDKYNAKQNDYREGDRKNVEKPGRTQRQLYSQCGFRAICGLA